jgi:penicillin-binding protein 1A
MKPIHGTDGSGSQFLRSHLSFSPKRNIKWYLFIAFILIIIIFGGYIYYLSRFLPPLTQLENINPALTTNIYSVDDKLISSIYSENRTLTPFNKLPQHLINALIATEDRRFYHHWGVDIRGLVRSLLISLFTLDKPKGTSTLTMQLSRNLYFGFERTWKRKIMEVITSIQIERTYSKNEIIEMYLNNNPFGSNTYGIHSAAKRFFSKKVEDLTVEESALLIGVLKGQTIYNPLRNPEKAIGRRNVVLKSMSNVHFINKEEYHHLSNLPLQLNPSLPIDSIAPYFSSFVKQQLEQLQDSLGINIREDGLKVYTSLDTRIQHFMEKAVTEKMPELERKILSQSTLQHLKKEISDSLFSEMIQLQIAFVCINPHNGYILAMIGGRDFAKSKFNRVTQALRQPGSAFKPFVYTAAIDNGYNPNDEFLNVQYVLIEDDGTRWTPENYSKTYSGLLTLRKGLRSSINMISVRLIEAITPRTVIKYAKSMGITSRLRPVYSLALGSSEVYLLDMVSAYGVFANNGIHVKPVSIIKIEDRTGNVIYSNRPEQYESLSKETTYIMNDLLQDVARQGTGYQIFSEYHLQSKVEVGGKTGTTNDETDAWFIGFTPQVATGVWIGFDDPKLRLGAGMTGAKAALPFWGEFMKMIYDSLEFQPIHFIQPSTVVTLKICEETNKLATPYCPKTYYDIFNIKSQPNEMCDKHKGIRTIKDGRKKVF